MGRLIPAGSGMAEYNTRRIKAEGEEPVADDSKYRIGQSSLESLAGLI